MSNANSLFRSRGFTLIEVLVALVVISVALGAVAFSQVNNTRASITSRLTSETKAAANQVLESVMAEVLVTTGVAPNLDFAFYDFYWSCPDIPAGAPADVTSKTCDGSRAVGDVAVDYSITGESGVRGEGVLTVTVTAEHTLGGQRLTIGDRVTCYDVYPSPTSTAPAPCPEPTESGGGRP